MSRCSRLGYAGEKPVLDFYLAHDRDVYPAGLLGPRDPYSRPRAGTVHDCGDIAGLPYVVSCKNCAKLELAAWVDALPRMCEAAKLATGIVIHKRRGKGNPGLWYVTTTLDLFMPFHDAYLMAELSG